MENQSGSGSLSSSLTRTLSLDIARVTEGAAVAAARLRGRGDEREADAAAVQAMHREIADLPVTGRVVIGEGERAFGRRRARVTFARGADATSLNKGPKISP